MINKIIERKNIEEITIKSNEILDYSNLEKFIDDNFRYEATYFYNDPMCIRDSKYCLIAVANDRDLLEQFCMDKGFTKSEKIFDGGYEIKDRNPVLNVGANTQVINPLHRYIETNDNMEFIWSDEEDIEIFKNGVTIIWAEGRSKAIQKFVETLSYKIGHECDWSFTGGRAHIDVARSGFEKACDVISDDEFMKQFIVPYSDKSYENESYFNILSYHGRINEIKTSKILHGKV